MRENCLVLTARSRARDWGRIRFHCEGKSRDDVSGRLSLPSIRARRRFSLKTKSGKETAFPGPPRRRFGADRLRDGRSESTLSVFRRTGRHRNLIRISRRRGEGFLARVPRTRSTFPPPLARSPALRPLFRAASTAAGESKGRRAPSHGKGRTTLGCSLFRVLAECTARRSRHRGAVLHLHAPQGARDLSTIARPRPSLRGAGRGRRPSRTKRSKIRRRSAGRHARPRSRTSEIPRSPLACLPPLPPTCRAPCRRRHSRRGSRQPKERVASPRTSAPVFPRKRCDLDVPQSGEPPEASTDRSAIAPRSLPLERRSGRGGRPAREGEGSRPRGRVPVPCARSSRAERNRSPGRLSARRAPAPPEEHGMGSSARGPRRRRAR